LRRRPRPTLGCGAKERRRRIENMAMVRIFYIISGKFNVF
jgi:hypothetical protein